MSNIDEIKNEGLKQASGGFQTNGDDTFSKVTGLLTEAGDRAWSSLGPNNGLWLLINIAQRATTYDYRKKSISNAMNYLETSKVKDSLSDDDYKYIYGKVSESKQLMDSIG